MAEAAPVPPLVKQGPIYGGIHWFLAPHIYKPQKNIEKL